MSNAARYSRPVLTPGLRIARLALFLAASIPASTAGAQGMIDRMKQKVQDRANNATDSLTDAALDKATGAVTCAATNTACIKKVLGAGKTVRSEEHTSELQSQFHL